MQKVKVKGQSVQKIEWKQMDGQMDGWKLLHYLPCKNAVIIFVSTVLQLLKAWEPPIKDTHTTKYITTSKLPHTDDDTYATLQ